MKKGGVIILSIIAGAVIIVLWRQFIRDDFKLPRGGETKTETIVIENGQVVETGDERPTTSIGLERPPAALEQEKKKKI